MKRISAVTLLFLLISIQLNAYKQGDSMCIVVYVVKGSTAENIGLKSGDVILSINGKRIFNTISLEEQIRSAKNKGIEIKVLRMGREIIFKSPFNTDKLGIATSFYERDRLFSPEEIKEDLDTIFSAISEIHPNPYVNISKQEFNVLKTEIYNKIKDSLCIKDFWKLASPIVAEIGDGHTHLDMPDGEWIYKAYSKGKIIFPISLHIIQDSALVQKNFSRVPIKTGSYILSINGVPIKKIINDFIPYISGELRHFKTAIIERDFSQMLFVIYGWEGPFKVKIKDLQGKIKKYTLKDVDKNIYDKMTSLLLDNNFHFEEMPALKTGIIRFNSFVRREEFDRFLKKSFMEIKEKKYKYLIIDLRKNGGGDSRIAEDLLNYLIDKPYRYFGGEQVKVSKHTIKYAKQELSNEKLVVDSIYSFEDPAKAPPKNLLRFKGKIFVLISNYTFSTASDFAAVIKDFEIGTLVGEETGGLPTSYGDSWLVVLPNSHLTLNVSWKYFVRPNGDTTYVRKGLIPDISVKTTEEDIRRGIDPVMQKVKDIINKDLGKKE